MLDPNTIMYCARLRQQEIYESIYGRRQVEFTFSLWDELTALWRALHPQKETAPDWQPPRTIRHAP
jgi:hypothetical protein